MSIAIKRLNMFFAKTTANAVEAGRIMPKRPAKTTNKYADALYVNKLIIDTLQNKLKETTDLPAATRNMVKQQIAKLREQNKKMRDKLAQISKAKTTKPVAAKTRRRII